jgi:uncharacterized protein
MEIKLLEATYLFVVFSISGWFLETVYRSATDRRFVNPGLLTGPWLPVYGFGALLIDMVKPQIPDSHFQVAVVAILSYLTGYDQLVLIKPLLVAFHIIAMGVVYIIAATLLEFSAGWLLERFFNVRLWDYHDRPWSIRGYVCLKFSLYWVVLAFALEHLLLPAAMRFYQASSMTTAIISLICIEIITIDFLIRADQLVATTRQKRRNDRIAAEREFLEIAAPLLSDPLVSSLENYRHHYLKTRLGHCMEVAWLSYRIAVKLHLDKRMTVRGALLHDLFYYDWLREGPRWHGFRHPRIALDNARKVTYVTKKEADIILRHMWPLTIIPPLYPEAWIVSTVDKYCGAKDYLEGLTSTLKKAIPARIVNRLK